MWQHVKPMLAANSVGEGKDHIFFFGTSSYYPHTTTNLISKLNKNNRSHLGHFKIQWRIFGIENIRWVLFQRILTSGDHFSAWFVLCWPFCEETAFRGRNMSRQLALSTLIAIMTVLVSLRRYIVPRIFCFFHLCKNDFFVAIGTRVRG